MKLTRREVLASMAAATQAPGPAITPGPFEATRESLRSYRAPEWFRDAKFGIWAHWGPQSAPEYGDWYARNMYIEDHRQYKYHCQKYGHPSKFGFKDIIPTWKAERFDAAALMKLYRKAGAKYFVSMGVHHDNFDLWNSRHNKWNAVNMGPKKDILGLFERAARKEGLRFGVSEHLAVSYHWFQTSHGADAEGPMKGVPYDGADAKYAALYHETHTAPKHPWNEEGVPEVWKQHYFDRVVDFLDRYKPDLLYTDGPIFFDRYGLGIAAHLYNSSAKRNRGKVDAVYANKGKTDCKDGICVLDLERGVVDRIWDEPWQTDTCIGHWHYDKEAKYKTPKIVIDMLVDIVSRNGNLLLNFPLPSNGMLDEQELAVLSSITSWMEVNGEAIYGTRPWKVFGGGGELKTASLAGMGGHHNEAAFNERNRKELAATDYRFTEKHGVVYTFLMGWPDKQVTIAELGTAAGKIREVELVGSRSKVEWSQDAAGLKIGVTGTKPSDHAVALRVRF